MTTNTNITPYRQDNDYEPRWGEANRLRGLTRSAPMAYVEHAVAFVETFPIGSVLSQSTFDGWLGDRGLLTVPHEGVSKQSDTWMGHLQRRHQHRNKLNKAATHPRMFKDMESTSFLIAAVANGFEVRSPHTAASKSELTKRLASLTVTKRKQLAYLMQSTDWAVLPPHERAIAETIYDDIVALEEDTGKSTERISKKLSRLEMRLAEALNRGDFSTSNGGLAHLLSHHPGDTEDTDDSPDAS